jgi:hypothetical protein
MRSFTVRCMLIYQVETCVKSVLTQLASEWLQQQYAGCCLAQVNGLKWQYNDTYKHMISAIYDDMIDAVLAITANQPQAKWCFCLR